MVLEISDNYDIFSEHLSKKANQKEKTDVDMSELIETPHD